MIKRRTIPRPKALWVTMRGGRTVAEVRPVKPIRRSRVRPRSRRMTKLMAYYNGVVKPQFLEANPRCAVHRDDHHAATQIHHKFGRASTLLLDARFFKGVCSAGHAFITAEPAAARRAGLLCAAGDWNTPPNDAETMRLKQLMREITNGHQP